MSRFRLIIGTDDSRASCSDLTQGMRILQAITGHQRELVRLVEPVVIPNYNYQLHKWLPHLEEAMKTSVRRVIGLAMRSRDEASVAQWVRAAFLALFLGQHSHSTPTHAPRPRQACKWPAQSVVVVSQIVRSVVSPAPVH